LQNNTFSGLFVGQNRVTLKSVDSTNNYLKEELSKSKPLPEGTVIMAEEQWAGRGQRSNQWLSEPGKNLTFSLLLNPLFLRPDQQFFLNQCISIAVNETLRTILGPSLKIKWPNDIYYGDDKLGGMLIENSIFGGRWKHAIVGIGINVNQVTFSGELINVTSIAKILHRYYDLQDLLSQICSRIEAGYLRLRSGIYPELSEEYLSRLYHLGESHRYRDSSGREFDGTIENVTDEGLLRVIDGSQVRSFAFKEIQYLK
jgi:BirA family transcriptional regulator, biotin operon repressor / biotin---[acetyl-CoA-carboxylase] ligase